MAFLRGNNIVPSLFVLDTQTQLLLNPQGVPVPGSNTPSHISLHSSEGAIDLSQTPVILHAGVIRRDVVFALSADSGVGIIVQRIVGTTRFLGRKAPKFEARRPCAAREVPEGSPDASRPWDRKVNGKHPPRGEYLVTVRSVTSKLQVRDLGKPVRVKIR